MSLGDITDKNRKAIKENNRIIKNNKRLEILKKEKPYLFTNNKFLEKNIELEADKVSNECKEIKTIYYLSNSVGFLAGCAFAYNKKSKFWGYIEYGILGSVLTGLIVTPFTYKKAIRVCKKT